MRSCADWGCACGQRPLARCGGAVTAKGVALPLGAHTSPSTGSGSSDHRFPRCASLGGPQRLREERMVQLQSRNLPEVCSVCWRQAFPCSWLGRWECPSRVSAGVLRAGG